MLAKVGVALNLVCLLLVLLSTLLLVNKKQSSEEFRYDKCVELKTLLRNRKIRDLQDRLSRAGEFDPGHRRDRVELDYLITEGAVNDLLYCYYEPYKDNY